LTAILTHQSNGKCDDSETAFRIAFWVLPEMADHQDLPGRSHGLFGHIEPQWRFTWLSYFRNTLDAFLCFNGAAISHHTLSPVFLLTLTTVRNPSE
jgi:hypothetical protein